MIKKELEKRLKKIEKILNTELGEKETVKIIFDKNCNKEHTYKNGNKTIIVKWFEQEDEEKL